MPPTSGTQPRDERRDNAATIIAIGLLAYASADIAHHVLGHGGACLALGGHIVQLSSIFVNCTVRGTAVDLAGPFANLALGLAALAAATWAAARTAPAMRLFLTLTAGFNLLWVALQLSYSVATRTDDFAWAVTELHLSAAMRYGLIACGALGYLVSVWALTVAMGGFADPRARARRIMWTAWLTAGAIACVTTLFDEHPVAAILSHAAPQSFLLSVGLLFVPAVATPHSAASAPPIGFSIPWIIAALVTAAASVGFLGPGFSI